MALRLPIEFLKTHSGLELVPRCEPSTYQPISPSGPVKKCVIILVGYKENYHVTG